MAQDDSGFCESSLSTMIRLLTKTTNSEMYKFGIRVRAKIINMIDRFVDLSKRG